MTRTPLLLALGLVPILATSACNAADPAANGAQTAAPAASTTADQRPFTATEISRFDQPWAMTFLPDGSLLAVYVRNGRVLAYLVLDQVQGDQLPVKRLYNEAKGGH